MPIDILGLSRKKRGTPRPSPLQSLPDELLEKILAICSQSDMASASSTCWRFSRITSRFLYRHPKAVTSDKAFDLFITLCCHRHLPSFVHTCELRTSLRVPPTKSPLDEDSFSKRVRKIGTLRTFPHRHALRDPLTLVAYVLKNMINLTKLEFFIPEKEVHLDFNSRLLGECCFQLRQLDTNLRFDTGMARFLTTQSSLEDLRIYSSAPLSSLDIGIFPKTCLSSLKSLSWTSRMPIEVVRALMKGRPIHKVNINICANVDDIAPIISFGPASHRIKTANFTFRDRRHPTFVQLEAMSFHFPNLVGLGIAVCTFTEDITKDLKEALKTFSHLERLYIYDEIHMEEATTRSLFQLAKAMFEECSTLKKIGFYLCDPYVTVEKIPSSSSSAKPQIVLRLKR